VTALDPATTFAVLAPLMIETAPEETEVMVGFEDRITVGLDDRMTVGLLDNVTVPEDMAVTEPLPNVTALDRITVGLDESVTVPEEILTAVVPEIENGPSVESATTRAAMVDVTALDPATTFAWLAPPAPPRMET